MWAFCSVKKVFHIVRNKVEFCYDSTMFKKLASILFILCVFGILIAGRFDFSPHVTAKVYRDDAKSGHVSYPIGHTFKNSETVSTQSGEFVELSIGSLIQVDLDENTNLKLKSLSKNKIRVGFGHGRILVNVNENDGGNLIVDTATAQHNIIGRVSFVGYDFNQMTSVIPLFLVDVGHIQTTIPLLNQSFTVTTPINIHDVNPPTIEPTTFDRNTGAYKTFYDWAERKQSAL